jgi:RNA polymerase sigma-70 factor (ECF subfamily)
LSGWDPSLSGRPPSVSNCWLWAPFMSDPWYAQSMSAAEPPRAPAEAAGGALTDDQLVERAQHGDLPAFEMLVERHEDRLYRLAVRLLRNDDDAREVLQEAFLSAWQKLGDFAGRAQFGSWIYRVTLNTALMLLRSRRRRPTVSAEDVPEGALDEALAIGRDQGTSDWIRRPDEQLQSGELKQYIQEALGKLPEILRVVFVLRDVEDLSTEETADALGITVQAVKTRLHRARLALRVAISDYFGRN